MATSQTRILSRRPLALALGSALILCLGLLGAAGYQARSNSAALHYSSEMVVHTFEVITAAQGLERTMREIERGQRGFLMTGNPDFIELYHRVVPLVAQRLAALRQVTRDNPDQQQRLLRFQSMAISREMELDRVLNQAQGADQATRMELAQSSTQSSTTAATEALLDEFIATEYHLLRGRLEDASAAQDRSTETTLIVAGGAVLLLAAAALLLARLSWRSWRAETLLQNTLDSVRDGVAAFDEEDRLTAWNRPFEQILRLPPGFAQNGKPVDAFESTEIPGEPGHGLGLAALDREAREVGQAVLAERRRADGSILELYHNPSADGGFVVSLNDITLRRRSEVLLQQAQRMESLGQLTGGVAHDFNNLLTIIIGNLDRLATKLPGESPLAASVQAALEGAERGARLTQQLLAYARKQPLDPKLVNLAGLLPETVALLRKTLGEGIEIDVMAAGGLWNTMVDPTQVESALLNLAINARDAMPDGGKLTIETGNAYLDAGYAENNPDVRPGQYVMLAVSDTGTGMPPDVAARAFDPFFTTKRGDKGTGLGLSMVYGFVKQSGGHAKIYSEPGHGTTIKLYLPRALSGEAPETKRVAAPSRRGSETVLVVEDDDGVRDTVMSMLEELGYRALEARDGASALTILEGLESIDLLFSDVVMPGSVNVRVLAATARQLRPDIKILYTSGYTENAIIHHGRLDDGVSLLSKPYRRDQLAAKLRDVLDAPVAAEVPPLPVLVSAAASQADTDAA